MSGAGTAAKARKRRAIDLHDLEAARLRGREEGVERERGRVRAILNAELHTKHPDLWRLLSNLVGAVSLSDVASAPEPRERVAAYVIDRAEQYVPSGGIYSALLDVAADIARGEAEEAAAHGELDDLRDRVRRIAGRRSR